MSIETIQNQFREKVCSELRLVQEGNDRFRVFTPFLFDDGDHLAIVLKRELGQWELSDEGHTYLHLSYDLDEKDLQQGTRQKIITNALSVYRVEDHHGELVTRIHDGQYGDALYSFVQALMRITDVSYLSRERVRSTFLEDFRALLAETVPSERRTFDWHDHQRDPNGMYNVDCRVNGLARPLFIYAVPNDERARDATISLLQFEKWGFGFRSLGIFEDAESVNRKVLTRFMDVFDKQYSNLEANRDRIINYLSDILQEKAD